MLIIRYLQLCWSILGVIVTKTCPPRKPRGDMRNYARSFYVGYILGNSYKRTITGPKRAKLGT